jgi:transposase
MNELFCHAIIQRYQTGQSLRRIARELSLSRNTVTCVVRQVEAQRQGQPLTHPARKPRPSKLDAFLPLVRELLTRYPDITIQRLLEELRARGFSGGYTILQERLRQLRCPASPQPVFRFETGPGLQAQMDYAVYDLDFLREGRRRVYLFSYLLSYSRRGYLRFVEAMDLATTLSQHVQAFHYLGGIAHTCLYDNFKAVVLRHDADGILYHPKFLAFATHYGFRPLACQPRRPQTKGKVEKRFHYVETNLLNGRTFDSLDQLNDVTAHWQSTTADVRPLRDCQQTPLQRYAQERPHLLPLPAADFDTAVVVYRHVNAEGFVAYRTNFYSVPYTYIGQILPVRITDSELLCYTPTLEEIARHPLCPRSAFGQRQLCLSHHPREEPQQHAALLQQRFAELGPTAHRFLSGLLAKQTRGKHQAQQLLALFAHYTQADVLAALERALHFGAFSFAAVQRILAATAKPKPLLQELADTQRAHLDPRLCQDPVLPRPASDYQPLLEPEHPPHDCQTPSPSTDPTAPKEKPQLPEPTDPARPGLG